MLRTGYYFQRIRAAVDSAEKAQEAGYEDIAAEILNKLVKDIQKEQGYGPPTP